MRRWAAISALLFAYALLAGCLKLVNTDPGPLPTINPGNPLPTPTPTPTLAPCPVIEDDDAGIVDQTQQFGPDYAAAITALKRAHPDWFLADGDHWRAPRAGDGGAYPTAPAIEAFRVEFYAALGAEFAKSLGLCSQVIGDELHVFDAHASPVISERYKAFEYGGGREMQKPYMGRTLEVVR